MKEVRSRKTGKVSILSDEEFEKLKSLGLSGKFTVLDVEPIIPMIPVMKIEPEIKIKNKIKKQ
jgi:hypothetical protein